jgi:hypothetical protein
MWTALRNIPCRVIQNVELPMLPKCVNKGNRQNAIKYCDMMAFTDMHVKTSQGNFSPPHSRDISSFPLNHKECAMYLPHFFTGPLEPTLAAAGNNKNQDQVPDCHFTY